MCTRIPNHTLSSKVEQLFLFRSRCRFFGWNRIAADLFIISLRWVVDSIGKIDISFEQIALYFLLIISTIRMDIGAPIPRNPNAFTESENNSLICSRILNRNRKIVYTLPCTVLDWPNSISDSSAVNLHFFIGTFSLAHSHRVLSIQYFSLNNKYAFSVWIVTVVVVAAVACIVLYCWHVRLAAMRCHKCSYSAIPIFAVIRAIN